MVKNGDDFFFFIVCMACQAFIATPHHLFFYGTVMSEILHIARSSSSAISCYEKTTVLITRIEKQRGNIKKS